MAMNGKISVAAVSLKPRPLLVLATSKTKNNPQLRLFFRTLHFARNELAVAPTRSHRKISRDKTRLFRFFYRSINGTAQMLCPTCCQPVGRLISRYRQSNNFALRQRQCVANAFMFSGRNALAFFRPVFQYLLRKNASSLKETMIAPATQIFRKRLHITVSGNGCHILPSTVFSSS